MSRSSSNNNNRTIMTAQRLLVQRHNNWRLWMSSSSSSPRRITTTTRTWSTVVLLSFVLVSSSRSMNVMGWNPSSSSSSGHHLPPRCIFPKVSSSLLLRMQPTKHLPTSATITQLQQPQRTRLLTQLYATIEKTRGQSSASSSDDDEEEDDDDDDEDTELGLQEVDADQIASLETLMQSQPSQPKQEQRSRKRDNKPQQQVNRAMHDPQFLRKRTADLLKVTEYAASSAATNQDDLEASSSSSSLSRHMKVEKKTFHFLLDAWAFSNEPDAAQQALTLLERMQQLSRCHTTAGTMQPDVRSYTKTINAIARQQQKQQATTVSSSSVTATATAATLNGQYKSNNCMQQLSPGEQAEQLLKQLKELYVSISISDPNMANSWYKPNAYTYTAVIQAHANHGNPERAEYWLMEHMVDQYQRGDDSVKPTAKAFNAVIYAYGKAGNAAKAHAVFQRMERLYNEAGMGDTTLKPNTVNYNALITAYANCGSDNTDHPQQASSSSSLDSYDSSVQRAEEVLEHMEYLYQNGDTSVEPTTVTFNAVIDALAKSGSETAAYKAEELLQRMDQLYEESNYKRHTIRPNTRSFNSVMNAWAKNRYDPDAANKAAELLQIMEQRYESGDTDVRPDVHSFCTVINAYARSSQSDKAELAYNLYQDMKKLYQAGTNPGLRPNVVAVNAVMNACAFTSTISSDIRQQNRAIEIAHSILKDLEQSPYGSPDQVTYGTFMKTCANLMPDSHTRQQIIEVLTKKCCRDGQLGNLVLQQLRVMASDELYMQLIGRSIHENIEMEDLPKEWWCNVVEGKSSRKRRFQQ